jgi:VanZ family protein
LLLAVAVGLIVYVSLYPFRVDAGGPGMLQALGQLTWARASRSDMLNNLLLYVPLGFCLVLMIEPRFRRMAALALATLAGAALSLAMELTQASIAPRVPSLTDLTLNTAGTLVGALAGSTWHAFGARMTPDARPVNRSRTVAGGIVALWILMQLWPLIPDPSLGQLKRAVRPLATPSFDAGEITAYLIGWLVVAQALFHLARGHRAVDVLLITIAVVLVGRAFVIGGTWRVNELVALALLLPSLVLLNRLAEPRRCALLAAALAAWLAWTALGPAAGRLHRLGVDWPALPDFLARRPPPLPQLAGKGFSYVGLAWLLAGAGLLPHVSAMLTVLFAALVCLLAIGAPGAATGWADIVIATVAGLIVISWMPRIAPAVRRR